MVTLLYVGDCLSIAAGTTGGSVTSAILHKADYKYQYTVQMAKAITASEFY